MILSDIYKMLVPIGLLLSASLVDALTFESDQYKKPYSDILIDKHITIKQINDKVIVLNMGYDAVTAINTDSGIVILDAGISGTLTTAYRKILATKFNSNHFKCLINTHAHSDHTGGNSAFRDIAIIAHQNCKQEMEQENVDPEKVTLRLKNIVATYTDELKTLKKGTKDWEETYCQMLRYQSAYNDKVTNPNIQYPTMYFADSLDFILGNFSFNLRYFGKAHSSSDILIYIPELKLLFTGDLFFPYGRLAFEKVGSQDNKQWEAALSWLTSIKQQVDVIVGGHGHIMRKDDLELFLNNVQKKMKGTD